MHELRRYDGPPDRSVHRFRTPDRRAYEDEHHYNMVAAY
jgi:hypothetical protein